MVEIARFLLQFIIVFLLVYFAYFIYNLVSKKTKRYDRKNAPVNVKYLVYKYNLDVVRIGYKKILKTLSLCDSFIIACLFSITSFISNTYVRLLVAFILVFPLFAGVYHLVATYYIKESEK